MPRAYSPAARSYLFIYLIKIGWEIRLAFEMFASLIIGIDIGPCIDHYIIIVLL